MRKLIVVFFTFLMFSSVALAQQPIGLYNIGGTALGAPSNYGTSPGAVTVMGVNAFVTNTPAVTQSGGPWTNNLTQLNSVALGSPSNYGTSPGAVSVMGVNAFITNSPAVTFAPSTSSTVALTRFHASSAAAANVKATAGNLYGLVLGNSGTVPCWLQVFNTAATPTAGTSVVDSYLVQAGVTVVVPAGTFALTNYTTGIGIAGATTDSGATTTGCTTTFSVTAYYL